MRINASQPPEPIQLGDRVKRFGLCGSGEKRKESAGSPLWLGISLDFGNCSSLGCLLETLGNPTFGYPQSVVTSISPNLVWVETLMNIRIAGELDVDLPKITWKTEGFESPNCSLMSVSDPTYRVHQSSVCMISRYQ